MYAIMDKNVRAKLHSQIPIEIFVTFGHRPTGRQRFYGSKRCYSVVNIDFTKQSIYGESNIKAVLFSFCGTLNRFLYYF